MNVGDVYYRKIDNCECKIKGFFFLYNDGYPSAVYSKIASIKHQEIKRNKQLYVLFTDDTFDTVENLFTNLYMTKVEYDTLQEHIQKMENANGLYSAMQIALDFPTTTPKWKQVYQEILNEQESYEGQHAEVYWNDNDLVPNPGESKRKHFKLW